jgi:hypothetical protein
MKVKDPFWKMSNRRTALGALLILATLILLFLYFRLVTQHPGILN